MDVPDLLVMNEISSYDGLLEVPNPCLDFSSSYLHSSDVYMQHFDPFFDNRLVLAIQYLKENCIIDPDVLVQLWLPVIRNDKRFLTTDHKHFVVDSDAENLSNYRELSKIYQFAAEDDSTSLPTLVFSNKFPVCVSDFQFVQENDPRASHARILNLCGCLGIPVFEPGGATCLGVVEVVTTSQKVNFRDVLNHISKALEVVDLRTSEFLIHSKLQDFNEPYQVVLAEIRDALRSICDTLKLPLAQTWSPCTGRSQQPVACISIIESGSYVFDPKILGFYQACLEQQLVQGEGIAGKALGTNQPCFTADIADFCRAEYPLVHEAKMFGLNGAVAIPVRSTYTGSMDFILEFFLPRDCKNDEEQNQILSYIVSMIKHLSWSLYAINDEELAKAASFSVEEFDTREESWISHMLEAQQKGETVVVSMGCHEEPEEEFKVMERIYHGFTFCEPGPKRKGQSSGTRRSSEKTEKNISLKILQQYFPGSLKDAAKSIGVCPTTLKRICRKHGIMRWPSRKIKKVSHSLKKLQLVIDSVQGADGTIQLGSFYANFPELISSVSPKIKDRATLLKSQTTASNSSSSCSLGSSSTGNPLDPVKLVDDYRSRDGGVFRVKAAYGVEKIRFRMSQEWGFRYLQGEIRTRFKMYEMVNMMVEYLDDDSELVLLTCDADLEECMDLHRSTKNTTIKLFVHQSCHPNDEIHVW